MSEKKSWWRSLDEVGWFVLVVLAFLLMQAVSMIEKWFE